MHPQEVINDLEPKKTRLLPAHRIRILDLRHNYHMVLGLDVCCSLGGNSFHANSAHFPSVDYSKFHR